MNEWGELGRGRGGADEGAVILSDSDCILVQTSGPAPTVSAGGLRITRSCNRRSFQQSQKRFREYKYPQYLVDMYSMM